MENNKTLLQSIREGCSLMKRVDTPLIELKMGNKYYTPEISDIRVGYECEICPNLGYDDVWIKTTGHCEEIVGNGVKSCNLDELTYDCLVDGYIGIRTPYLTKEQIEGEGWKLANTGGLEKGCINGSCSFSKGKYILYFTKIINKEGKCIINMSIHDELDDYYRGLCPSINELRYISKLLNIK